MSFVPRSDLDKAARSAPRILCYAPYNLWALHGMWEMTILNALRLRGADVRYVMCDGLYAECDLFRPAWEGGKPEDACLQCQACQTDLASKMIMPFQWLGRYLSPEDFREAERWVGAVAREDLLTAVYKDWAVGEWIESSINTYFRVAKINLNDPQVETACRRYLYSGLIACFGLDRLLDDYQPDIFFGFNGRMSSTRVAFELARKKGVRVLCHERGVRMETLQIFDNASCASIEAYKEFWDAWGDTPLNEKELEITDEYLIGRQYGKGMSWYAYSPPPEDYDSLLQKLNLHPERPVWALFTSSEDEIAANKERAGIWAKQIDWINRSIQYIAQHPGIDLVIRCHPNSSAQELEDLAALRHDLPENVRVVMPGDDISTYTLMDITTLGLVYISTVSLEMACRGKPVVLASKGCIHDMPFVHTVKAVEEYEPMLDELLDLPLLATSVEIRKLAYRFAYSMFFRYVIPFPLVKMPNLHAGELAYNSLEELLPGKDASLDRICRIFLEGELVVPPPSEEERRHRSDEGETQWLIEQSKLKILAPPAPPANRESDVGHISKDHTPGLTSIIVLNYNGLHHIKKCIRSIKECTGAPYELIVIDNGSTDGSRAYLRGIPGIRLVENPKNIGAPAGRNQGIAIARGEFFVFLDNDTMVTEGWLERFLVFAESNPSYGLLGPMSNCVFGEQLVFQPGYTTYEELQAFGRDWALKFKGQGVIKSRLILFCLFARREVILKIGGIDPIYGKWGFEDDDFCLRARIAGYQCVIVNEVFIHHTGGQKWMIGDVEIGGSQKSNVDYDELMEENWSVFRKKWNVDWAPGERMIYYPNVILDENPFDSSRHIVPTPPRAEIEKLLSTGARTADAARERDEEPASIAWTAPLLEAGADAQSARQVILGLDSQDIRIAIYPVKMSNQPERILSHEYYRLEQLARQPLDERFVHIQEIDPQHFQTNSGALAHIGRPSIGCDRLPEEWVVHCNSMDEIWVTSDSELEAFALSGVDRSRLHKVPVAIDLQQFSGRIKPADLNHKKGFNFLSVLDWHPRSGWDILIQAYAEEFKSREDVSLVIKLIAPVGQDDESIVQETFRFLKDELKLKNGEECPAIEFYFMAPSLSFYRTSNVFVYASRSETHGSYCLEAMASGLPVIATGWGGQTEFMTEENSWEINYTMPDIPKEIVDQEPHLAGLRWAEPSITHLRKLMRNAFKHRREARRKGAAARKHIAANHDRNKVAQQVNDRLKEIFSQAGKQLEESGIRDQGSEIRDQVSNKRRGGDG